MEPAEADFQLSLARLTTGQEVVVVVNDVAPRQSDQRSENKS